MLRKTLIAVALILTSSAALAARLENARLVEHNVSRSLGADIRQYGASPSAVWIAWDAPVADADSYMCCFNSMDEGRQSKWRGGRCSLGGKRGNFINGNTNAVPPTTRTTFSIFARVEKGLVMELRMFSEDCEVDGEGLTVHRLSGVSPADSIAWLEAYAQDDEPRSKKDAHQAAAAIANHGVPQAVDALERLVRNAKSTEVRANAAFWLGHRGGARGRRVLREVIDESESHRIIDQAIAGIAQDPDREATDLLLTFAKTHRWTQVRKQSIFWLGQRAGEKATAHLKEATDDPDEDVREMAVFSISQLPRERAVPELIQLAKTHKSKRVRERAIFWLGQSGDPRALEFIEDVLTK